MSFIQSITYKAGVFVTGTVLLFFIFSPLYSFRNWTLRQETSECLRSVFYAWLVSMLFAWSAHIPFRGITAGLAAFVPMTLSARYLLRRLLSFLGVIQVDVIVSGAGSAGTIFTRYINASPFTLRKIRGFLDDDPSKKDTEIDDIPVLGRTKDFRRIQESMNIDEVVVAEPEAPRKTIISTMHKFRNYARNVYLLSTNSTSIRGIRDLHLASSTGGLLNPANRFIKTVMDYTGGLMVFLLTAPLMLFIGWKIKHDDGGSVFFKHLRAGLNLKPFLVCKFRTMIPNAEQILKEMLKDDELRKEFGTAFKFKNDPRVTPFGKFLRHTSLDELPQIFNVLKGEMSLVGPRPIVHEEVSRYYGPAVSKHIFCTKPGMTGLWQVSGRNDVEDYDLRIKYDMYYVHHWSVLLDIMIMLRTVWVVLNGKGAY